MKREMNKKINELTAEQMAQLDDILDKMLSGEETETETKRETPKTYLNVNEEQKIVNVSTPIKTVFNAIKFSAKENGATWNRDDKVWKFKTKKGYKAFLEKASSYDNVVLGEI